MQNALDFIEMKYYARDSVHCARFARSLCVAPPANSRVVCAHLFAINLLHEWLASHAPMCGIRVRCSRIGYENHWIHNLFGTFTRSWLWSHQLANTRETDVHRMEIVQWQAMSGANAAALKAISENHLFSWITTMQMRLCIPPYARIGLHVCSESHRFNPFQFVKWHFPARLLRHAHAGLSRDTGRIAANLCEKRRGPIIANEFNFLGCEELLICLTKGKTILKIPTLPDYRKRGEKWECKRWIFPAWATGHK